jgi:RNA polymerase sigma factor (sigma-70 family)
MNSMAIQQKELLSLYKKWPQVKKHLKKYGCSGPHAEDIFQEALLVYVRKKDEDSLQLTTEPIYYIQNVCKYMWYNQHRKEGKSPLVPLDEVREFETDEDLQKENKFLRVEKAIEKIGEKCRQLLQMFYGHGMNMSEIAVKLGFRNDKVAKAQKYRCLNDLKDAVRNENITQPSL